MLRAWYPKPGPATTTGAGCAGNVVVTAAGAVVLVVAGTGNVCAGAAVLGPLGKRLTAMALQKAETIHERSILVRLISILSQS